MIKSLYIALMFAGTDTSSHVVAMTLYNLAHNPQIKVYFLT